MEEKEGTKKKEEKQVPENQTQEEPKKAKGRKMKNTEEKEKDPNQKEYSLLSNMAYIMKGTFRFQKPLVWFLLFAVLMSVANTYLPTFALSAVVEQISKQVEFNALLRTVLLFFGIMLVVGVVLTWSYANIWWRMIDARVQFMMMRIHKVLYMDYEYIESAKVMEACQKAMRATGGNTNGVEGMMHSAQNTAGVVLSGLTAIVIVCRLSPWMVLLLLLLGVLNYFNMDYTKKRDKKTWDELAPYWRKTWYMQQTMSNFVYGKDIRLFSMKGWLLGKYASLNDFIHRRMVESKNRWIGCSMVNQVLFLAEEGSIYAYLIYRVLKTDMSLADFTLYLGAVRSFFGVLQQIFNGLTDMKAQSREINDFRSFLEYPEREVMIPGAKEDAAKSGAAGRSAAKKEKKRGADAANTVAGGKAWNDKILPLCGQEKYEFCFENVSFRYPEAEHYALKNLNLTLAAGERLAVVGLNGAGKSTFIKLLCGLYMPTEGRILLNGVDIRCYDKREYYELFSPVFQNVELFAFRMDENVSMKVGDETDTAFAEECLRAAGLGEKIDSLPKGVRTDLLKIISEDGIDLSGGESQKLALARALYKKAPIVVLDEPTSALDALAEYRMYQNFDSMIGKKSAVYISHRLSSTRFCDHVAMFADGELKEYGTHESLLEAGGAYRGMFDVQAQYYKEGGAECE